MISELKTVSAEIALERLRKGLRPSLYDSDALVRYIEETDIELDKYETLKIRVDDAIDMLADAADDAYDIENSELAKKTIQFADKFELLTDEIYETFGDSFVEELEAVNELFRFQIKEIQRLAAVARKIKQTAQDLRKEFQEVSV